MALVAFADTIPTAETDKEMNSKSQLIYTLLSSIAQLDVSLYEVPLYKPTKANADLRGERKGVGLRRREVSRRCARQSDRAEKRSRAEAREEETGEASCREKTRAAGRDERREKMAAQRTEKPSGREDARREESCVQRERETETSAKVNSARCGFYIRCIGCAIE